jgi:hypothetical protein
MKKARQQIPCRLEWGGIRTFDALLRKWAAERLPCHQMARRLASEHGVAVTGTGIRSYCVREGFELLKRNHGNLTTKIKLYEH